MPYHCGLSPPENDCHELYRPRIKIEAYLLREITHAFSSSHTP